MISNERQLISVLTARTNGPGGRKCTALKDTLYVNMTYCYLKVNHGKSKLQIVKCRTVKKQNNNTEQ